MEAMQILYAFIGSLFGVLLALLTDRFVEEHKEKKRNIEVRETLNNEFKKIGQLLRDRGSGVISSIVTPAWDSVVATGDMFLLEKTDKKNKDCKDEETDYDTMKEIYAMLYQAEKLDSKDGKKDAGIIDALIDEIIAKIEKIADVDGKEDIEQSKDNTDPLFSKEWSMVKCLEKFEGFKPIKVTRTFISFTTKNLERILPPPGNQDEPYFAHYFISRRKEQGVNLNLWASMKELDAKDEDKRKLLEKYNNYLKEDDKPLRKEFRKDISVGVKVFGGSCSKTRENIKEEEFEEYIKKGVEHDKKLGNKVLNRDAQK
ncbi:MAG: hypothetical protein FWE06_01995 [Oscillospiraceae bacterium]|nr:hypothetical protein [Oscillospiraceae bacterium]